MRIGLSRWQDLSTREVKKLRDPVHKDILLTAEEVGVLDTAAMQRMRGVRQLGSAYLVYPGARHSRFEHGVGTCWMAKRILDQLRQSSPGAISPEEERAVCLAALVHDVTHVPFGHTFEDERRLFQRHDQDGARFRHFYEAGELGAALDAAGLGDAVRSILRREGRPCLWQIVSGTVCADLLDYLRRDNYFCGLSHSFDDRLFHYFRVDGDQLVMDLHQHGIFRRDALSEITNLLRIRYILSERVYYHHTKIASGVMLSKALERAMARGLRQRELYGHSDDTLLYHLVQRYGGDRGVKALVEGFRTRRIFKRCYTVSREVDAGRREALVRAHHFNRNGERDAAERAIAREAHLREHEVAIYCPPPDMALKEARVPVSLEDGVVRSLGELNSDEIEVLKGKHRGLWRFYVFVAPGHADAVDRAGRAAQAVIGAANELPMEKRGIDLSGP